MAQKPKNATHTLGISILAGGLSTRMGCDKTRLRLGRRTLLGHVRATAKELALPLRVIRKDAVSRCGPLGGIYTALQSSHARAELFLSCDMPFVSVRLLRQLVDKSSSGRQAVFTSDFGRVGFPFLLPVSCLRKLEHQLAEKEFSIQSLAAVLQAKRVRAKTAEILNINTQEELRNARRTIRVG